MPNLELFLTIMYYLSGFTSLIMLVGGMVGAAPTSEQRGGMLFAGILGLIIFGVCLFA